MAPLDHCLLSATFPPHCPIIVLLTLCTPIAHTPTAALVLASSVNEDPGRRRRRAAAAEHHRPGVEDDPAGDKKSSVLSTGTALCPPTGAAPSATLSSPRTERPFLRVTTARTSPSFTPLLPGLIAGGVGITLLPQRPWIPAVSVRERPTPEPRFEEDAESNVTGRAGSVAYLDCRVEMQQDLAVTWLHRKEDSIQLLTVGRHPYSADSRFLLSHEDPNNWRLRILPVMKSDEGLYECQIATHPIKVRKVFFHVTAPDLKIVDEDFNELAVGHYKVGSEVKLTCLATQLEEEDGLGGGGAVEEEAEGVQGVSGAFNPTQPPSHRERVGSRVLWRRGDSTITRSTAEKTLSPESSADGKTASVMLTFYAIKAEDEGNYTCSLGVVTSAAVHIKIINGKDGSHTRNTATLLGGAESWYLWSIAFPLLNIVTCQIVSQLILCI